MLRRLSFVLSLWSTLAAGPLLADNLAGADAFLCTVLEATACELETDCVKVAPWEINMPRFIEVDLAKKELRTTAASQENRSTSIELLRREAGVIVLQGFQEGRAFSIVIHEESGELSAAVARDGRAVAAFGACTTLPSSK
jgi:hypothetical protein